MSASTRVDVVLVMELEVDTPPRGLEADIPPGGVIIDTPPGGLGVGIPPEELVVEVRLGLPRNKEDMLV